VPVKGARRSLIADLQRHHYQFIPNALYEILTQQCEHQPYHEIAAKFSEEDQGTLASYFQMLIENEFGFWIAQAEKGFFPDLELTWDYPAKITNLILEVDPTSGSNVNYSSLFEQIDLLGTKDVLIQYTSGPPDDFIEIYRFFQNKLLKNIEIRCLFDETKPEDYWEKFLDTYRRVNQLTVYGAPFSRDKKLNLEPPTILTYKKEKLIKKWNSSSSAIAFTVNIKSFSEAQTHNLFFNRKLAIDSKGFMKNFLSQETHYGNINEISVAEVIQSPAYQEYWDIDKKKIEICKDCEFRFFCVDALPPVKKNASLWQRPFSCEYDPYSAKWLNELTFHE
jgi:SPASM domain peptide maturase of grasp-with-spasm system